MNHGAPKLTLLIPTRERAGTLLYAIKSALADPNPNVEILVSDNASLDNTKDVIASFSDPRLRYINPGQRLSMVDHWEFAVARARGDYVTVIGDDDAVNRNGYGVLLNTIKTHPSKIYAWPTHVYLWPQGSMEARVKLLIPPSEPYEMDLPGLVRKAVRWGIFNYAPLPHLYHSAVHRGVLDEIKQRTGSYFKTTQPDVYMSYAIPAITQTAVNVGVAVTTNGHSAQSNGGACLIKGTADTELRRFAQENKEHTHHARLPRGIDPTVASFREPLFVAMDEFPDAYADVINNDSAAWAFIESILWDNLKFSVLQNWTAIKQTSDLTLYKYLFYATVFRVNKIRARLLSAPSFAGPADVFQFSQNDGSVVPV